MHTIVAVARRVRLGRLVVAIVLSAASVDAAQGPTSPAALRIVVIAGEDAINIIQQKTAVAPIVEVRDRNDQPVAGAIVSFAIRNGRATFAGARTLSVTTDIAGRAVAAGLTPTGSGALQISATAAFQGQTAVAAIAQTNVLTVAQAAAIGGGAGGGGGAGTAAGAGGAATGGGGINGLTLGLLGAGAGAGALAAVKAAGGDNNPTSSAPPPSPPAATPLPSNVLYDIVFTPSVSTVAQCPGAIQVPGTGPFGTAVSFTSTGSFSGDLFLGVSGQPGTPTVRIAGQWMPTGVSGTMLCIAGGGPTGSLSGTGTPSQYQGTWTFGNLGGPFSLTPK